MEWNYDSLKTLKRKPAVYLIRNRVTGDSYVGASTNVYKRIIAHRCNINMRRRLTVASETSFPNLADVEFAVLEYVRTGVPTTKYFVRTKSKMAPGLRFLFEREQAWIDFLQPTVNRNEAVSKAA